MEGQSHAYSPRPYVARGRYSGLESQARELVQGSVAAAFVQMTNALCPHAADKDTATGASTLTAASAGFDSVLVNWFVDVLVSVVPCSRRLVSSVPSAHSSSCPRQPCVAQMRKCAGASIVPGMFFVCLNAVSREAGTHPSM